ncbi:MULTISPECIES: hypothetical protein [Streptomyces]|uniref:hypothetical protein n=1 Tax=Streptomyces TaxID=1883 RepID=UPI00206E1783|nr:MULTISPECIES: hypothetical protein [Streptomyces]UPT41768.1 hypothetical protein MWG59_10205 [Streptomyces sp. WAC00303]WIY76000.1 hypothetical protein QPM16_10065 [Streptomyces anulatus]
MIIVYTPEGGEPERLDAGRLRASEIQIAERTADRPWESLKGGLVDGDVTALRTLAWVIKKRTDPNLRFSAFDPFEDELKVRLDARETHRYAAEMFARYGHDPDELAGAWAELREAADDLAIADAAIKEQTDGPKAEPDASGSVTSETSTSASSPSTSGGPPTKSTP